MAAGDEEDLDEGEVAAAIEAHRGERKEKQAEAQVCPLRLPALSCFLISSAVKTGASTEQEEEKRGSQFAARKRRERYC